MFGAIRLRPFLTSLGITFGVGILSSLLTGNAFGGDPNLIQAPLTPPPWVFGVVWTILYLLTGISLYLIRSGDNTLGKQRALRLFYSQLVLQFIWPILYFVWGVPCISATVIVLLLILVVLTVIAFWKENPIAGAILLPYLAWCIFATYLNIAVCILNS